MAGTSSLSLRIISPEPVCLLPRDARPTRGNGTLRRPHTRAGPCHVLWGRAHARDIGVHPPPTRPPPGGGARGLCLNARTARGGGTHGLRRRALSIHCHSVVYHSAPPAPNSHSPALGFADNTRLLACLVDSSVRVSRRAGGKPPCPHQVPLSAPPQPERGAGPGHRGHPPRGMRPLHSGCPSRSGCPGPARPRTHRHGHAHSTRRRPVCAMLYRATRLIRSGAPRHSASRRDPFSVRATTVLWIPPWTHTNRTLSAPLLSRLCKPRAQARRCSTAGRRDSSHPLQVGGGLCGRPRAGPRSLGHERPWWARRGDGRCGGPLPNPPHRPTTRRALDSQ